MKNPCFNCTIFRSTFLILLLNDWSKPPNPPDRIEQVSIPSDFIFVSQFSGELDLKNRIM